LLSHRHAAAILVGFLAVFFWQPLTSGGVYAPADILGQFPVLRHSAAPLQPHNALASDVVFQMVPFAEWNLSELRQGRIPLWNPYSGAGAPHLANFQSAVFSPFSVPPYVLGPGVGLLLAAFLKLFACGFLTYLFLRRIGLDFWPAMSGGVLYMFSGYIMVWLPWHNSGASAVLPAGAYFTERLIAQGGRSTDCAWLAAVLALGLLCGHPETLFFAVLALCAYWTFRVFAYPEARTAWIRLGLMFAGAGAVAAAVCAVQLLPFFEYLSHSAEIGREARRSYPNLHWTTLVLQLCPDLLGNPATAFKHSPVFNFCEQNGAYLGAAACYLISVGVLGWYWNRQRQLSFFLGLLAAWAVYAYDPLGIQSTVIRHLPLIGLGIPRRSCMVGTFAGSAVVALTAQWLLQGGAAKAARILPVWAAAFLLLPVPALLSILHLVPLGSPEAGATIPWRMAAVLTALLAVVAGTLLQNARILGAGLPVILFVQSGLLFRGNYASVPAEIFYPHQVPATEIAQRTGMDLLATQDSAWLPPNVSTTYRIRIPGNYDVMEVRWHTALREKMGGLPHVRALQLLGVRYLASTDAQAGMVRADSLPVSNGEFVPLGGRRIEETFTASQPGLNAIRIAAAGGECQARAELHEGSRLVASQALDCRDPWLRFAVQPDSRGKAYRVSVEGNAAVRNPPGMIASTSAGVSGWLRPVWRGNSVHLLQLDSAMPRFSTVGQAEVIGDDIAAQDRMLRPDFDPLSKIVLASGVAEGNGETGTVTVAEETPVRIRLQMDRKSPGWLMATHTWYPGWRAVVNGAGAEVMRANTAFTAVRVGAGRSEVLLYYDPWTFRVGLWISIGGLAALAALYAAGRRV